MGNARFWTLVGIICLAAATRLIPHPPNFTPIAAMALFGGAHFANRRAAFLVPLAAMYLSDVVLGAAVYNFGWFHGMMPFVYGSFALSVLLGRMLRGRATMVSVSAAALGGSSLFFIVTNFGFWLRWDYYPATWEGLVACYAAAIPYFRTMLAGDLFFTALLFGGFAMAGRRARWLRAEPEAAG